MILNVTTVKQYGGESFILDVIKEPELVGGMIICITADGDKVRKQYFPVAAVSGMFLEVDPAQAKLLWNISDKLIAPELPRSGTKFAPKINVVDYYAKSGPNAPPCE